MNQDEPVGESRQGKVPVAPMLRFELRDELQTLRQQEGYRRGQPTGRTLVKEPDLRVVLMALAAGARLEAHRASGPITVQALEGRIRLTVGNDAVELSAGQLLALEAGVEHDVEGLEAAAFLLTIGRTTYHDIRSGHHQADGTQGED